MVNKNKERYVKLAINYIKQFPDKFNKLIVYGESVDTTIKNPISLDFAIGLVNKSDATNYDLLGDVISYLGDIVDEGGCTLLPFDEDIVSTIRYESMTKGDVVYEIC